MAEIQPIRVIVAEGRPLVRDLVSAAMAQDGRIHPEFVEASLDSVLASLKEREADVVLFSASSMDVGVGRFVRSVACSAFSVPVVVLAPDHEDECVYEALEAGAAGFVTPDTKLDELKGRLLAAAARQTVLPTGFVMQVLDRTLAYRRAHTRHRVVPGLTSREHEILELLTEGHSNAEIAQQLGVTTNTVKNHLYSIYRKLGVKSRSQAFATVAQMDLAV